MEDPLPQVFIANPNNAVDVGAVKDEELLQPSTPVGSVNRSNFWDVVS